MGRGPAKEAIFPNAQGKKRDFSFGENDSALNLVRSSYYQRKNPRNGFADHHYQVKAGVEIITPVLTCTPILVMYEKLTLLISHSYFLTFDQVLAQSITDISLLDAGNWRNCTGSPLKPVQKG